MFRAIAGLTEPLDIPPFMYAKFRQWQNMVNFHVFNFKTLVTSKAVRIAYDISIKQISPTYDVCESDRFSACIDSCGAFQKNLTLEPRLVCLH